MWGILMRRLSVRMRYCIFVVMCVPEAAEVDGETDAADAANDD